MTMHQIIAIHANYFTHRVKFLINRDANVNIYSYGFIVTSLSSEYGVAASSGEWVEGTGYSPLHDAAMYGSYDCLHFLLNNGARVNDKSTAFNDTPLSLAINAGSLKCIKELIARGAVIRPNYLSLAKNT